MNTLLNRMRYSLLCQMTEERQFPIVFWASVLSSFKLHSSVVTVTLWSLFTTGWKLLDFTLAAKTTDSLLNSWTLILNIFRLTFLHQEWENSHECDFFFDTWPAAWSQKILVFWCFASLSWHAQTTEWTASVIHFNTAFQTTTKPAVFFYF